MAAPFTSGLREALHLHFEVRLKDYDPVPGSMDRLWIRSRFCLHGGREERAGRNIEVGGST